MNRMIPVKNKAGGFHYIGSAWVTAINFYDGETKVCMISGAEEAVFTYEGSPEELAALINKEA